MRKLLIFFACIANIIFASVEVRAREGIQWYNPIDSTGAYVSGRWWNDELADGYTRMPQRMQEKLPRAVWNLSQNSAGLSVRFKTNSRNVEVRYVLANKPGYVNMARLNHSGVDLYARDANGSQYWIGNHMGWNFGDTVTISYHGITPRSFADRGLDYELFLPPYNTVKMLEIGVDSGSSFRFLSESAERPIVVYGSSIVQGASPSRPGLMWTTQVKRDMDYPVINLGFSGSALMEPSIFEAMGEIPARAYVLDPMPNSYKLGQEIYNRLTAGIDYLRSKNDAPILLVENAGAVDSVLHPYEYNLCREGDRYMRKAYEDMKARGVKGLYYLPFEEIGMDEDSYIEGTHPNDIGNRIYAKAVENKLREMLPEDAADNRYPPVRQFRDGVYEWWERHNDVIRLNHTTDPEALFIGNSITHFWGGEPKSHCYGEDTWPKTWGKRRIVNMGFGWDRIENVFWRINHGELEGCSPRDIFLLIGINNINNGDSEADVAGGIVRLAKAIHARQPQARLHVLKIYPAKGREEKVARTNALLEQWLPTQDGITLLDLNECLLLPDGSGKINPEMFREGLHPNKKGYTAIGKALMKALAKEKR